MFVNIEVYNIYDIENLIIEKNESSSKLFKL